MMIRTGLGSAAVPVPDVEVSMPETVCADDLIPVEGKCLTEVQYGLHQIRTSPTDFLKGSAMATPFCFAAAAMNPGLIFKPSPVCWLTMAATALGLYWVFVKK